MPGIEEYKEKLKREIVSLQEENVKIAVRLGEMTEDEDGQSLLEQACTGNKFASRRYLELQDPALEKKREENMARIRTLLAQLGEPVPKTFDEFMEGVIFGDLDVENEDDYFVSDPKKLRVLRKS